MYAECPHCHAIFRVTPRILRVANGKVRCGECQTVFDTGISADELEQSEQEVSIPAQGDLITETLDENPGEDLDPDSTQILENGPHLGITEINSLDSGNEDNELQASLFEEETPQEPLSGEAPLHERDAKPTTKPGTAASTQSEKPRRDAKARRNASPKRASPLRHVAALLALLLVGLLFAQYLYKNRGELARYDSLRPLLSSICQVARCELPPQSDINKIALLNHGVYSHPNIENALMIKATITNQAGFEQPLPIIELSLSNVRGKKLALRRFTPNEYLPEDKIPANGLMPIGRKIPISLQVIDPGKEALAFEFEFLQP